MKLDLSVLQYLSADDYRVLTAIEMGMRNHEIVPVTLIQSIAKLKRGNTFKVIQNLLKHKLLEHSNTKYDGYCLNYLGYDFLALNVLIKRKILVGVGSKVGVGKESDIFLCYINEENLEILNKEEKKGYLEDEIKQESQNLTENKIDESVENKNINVTEETKEVYISDNMKYNLDNGYSKEPKLAILKLARLGRTSFRAVRTKRDYLKNRTQYNWLYLSRLSAESEYRNLKGLYNFGFPVPRPYEHNRHAIIMEFIPGYPLCNIIEIGEKEKAFNQLIGMILKLANCGLVHGDFNEFNILLTQQQKIYLIDFPQMISTNHQDAKEQFDRDVECIFNYFRKKFNITFDERPNFDKDVFRSCHLDIDLKAPGYNGKREDFNNDIKEDGDNLEEEKVEEEVEEEEEVDEEEEEEVEEKDDNDKKIGKKNIEYKKEKNIDEMLDDLEIEEEYKNDEKQESFIEQKHDKIKEDVAKTIKKYTKVNFKSNRFKNKKTAKSKNSFI